jgi:hypothetical protein
VRSRDDTIGLLVSELGIYWQTEDLCDKSGSRDAGLHD